MVFPFLSHTVNQFSQIFILCVVVVGSFEIFDAPRGGFVYRLSTVCPVPLR